MLTVAILFIFFTLNARISCICILIHLSSLFFQIFRKFKHFFFICTATMRTATIVKIQKMDSMFSHAMEHIYKNSSILEDFPIFHILSVSMESAAIFEMPNPDCPSVHGGNIIAIFHYNVSIVYRLDKKVLKTNKKRNGTTMICHPIFVRMTLFHQGNITKEYHFYFCESFNLIEKSVN